MTGPDGMDRLYGTGWRDQPAVLAAGNRMRKLASLQARMESGQLYELPHKWDRLNSMIEAGQITPARRKDP